MSRRYFRQNPFQLDLFIHRVRLGIRSLMRLRSGMSFWAPSTGLTVTFRFARRGLFFFQTADGIFSAVANQAAMLELFPSHPLAEEA